jgi:hypothetical protein
MEFYKSKKFKHVNLIEFNLWSKQTNVQRVIFLKNHHSNFRLGNDRATVGSIVNYYQIKQAQEGGGESSEKYSVYVDERELATQFRKTVVFTFNPNIKNHKSHLYRLLASSDVQRVKAMSSVSRDRSPMS